MPEEVGLNIPVTKADGTGPGVWDLRQGPLPPDLKASIPGMQAPPLPKAPAPAPAAPSAPETMVTKVRTPQGDIVPVQHPVGASDDEILDYAKNNYLGPRQAQINAMPALSGLGMGMPSVGPMMGPAAPLAGPAMIAGTNVGKGLGAILTRTGVVPALEPAAAGGSGVLSSLLNSPAVEKMLIAGSLFGVPGAGRLHSLLRMFADKGAGAAGKAAAAPPPANPNQLLLNFDAPVSPYNRVLDQPALSPGEISNARSILADKFASKAGPGAPPAPTTTPPPAPATGTRPPLAEPSPTPDAITELRRRLQEARNPAPANVPGFKPEAPPQPTTGTRPTYKPGPTAAERRDTNILADEATQGAANQAALTGRHVSGTGTGIRLNQDWLGRWLKTLGDQ